MNISHTATSPAAVKTDLLALPCDEESLGDRSHLKGWDDTTAKLITRAVEDERFRGKPGQTVVVALPDSAAQRRVALIGVGPRARVSAAALLVFAGRAARAAQNVSARSLALVATETASLDPSRTAEALVQGALLGIYRFDRYLSEDKRSPRTLETLQVVTASPLKDADETLARGRRIAAAVSRARDLVNEPPAMMTPTKLAAVAKQIADEHQIDIQVFGPDECAKRGMGLFLAVAQGSTEEPRFIHLAWRPANAKKRIVLVGKGVTFDSGGLSLKPNDSMLDMKTDMAGAAAVLSVMELVAAERLPIEVHALAACTENMPSGNAYKLGDVFRSKAGKTVEINNTDAEGRLTLADAISYGLELKPDAMFDFATLTGACMVALGPFIAGVMSNDDALATGWLDAAKTAGEEMWRLPLPERLMDQLKSDIADMKNTGERWGGALTAGLFLKEFVGQIPWVHVDLAGPSSTDKEQGHVTKGGTGFAVATIFEYLRRVPV